MFRGFVTFKRVDLRIGVSCLVGTNFKWDPKTKPKSQQSYFHNNRGFDTFHFFEQMILRSKLQDSY